MKKADIFWQTYLNLEKEAIEVSKYIFFTDEVLVNSGGGIVAQSCTSQLEAFSPHISDLLVRCCVQIEALSKELYFDNGGTKPRGDTSILFDEDCLKLIDIKWQTHNKVVLVVAPFFNFTKDENRILKPLKEAHKRQGTYWERAYQAVKHDRYSSLQKGNVKAFIHALAALYLLNLYYRNDSWVTKYQDISKQDYSMGSAIFAVKAPVVNQPWYRLLILKVLMWLHTAIKTINASKQSNRRSNKLLMIIGRNNRNFMNQLLWHNYKQLLTGKRMIRNKE